MKRYIRLLSVALIVFAVGSAAFAEETMESLMERARNLYGVGDYQNALVLFQRAADREKNNGEALDYAGWCHRYIGNWASAEKTFQTALTLLPDVSGKWVHVGLGETYLGAPVYEKAVGSFQQAMRLAPDDTELVVRSLKGIVLAYALLGDEGKMAETVAMLTSRDSKAAETIVQDARVLLEQAKKAKAANTEPAAEAPLSNGDSRRQEVVEDNKDVPHSDKGVEIWGFSLGETMESVLAKLGAGKIHFSKMDGPTEFGSWLYLVDAPKPSPLPDFLVKEAKGVSFLLTEYDGKLMAVSAMVLWNVRNPVVKKSDMWNSMLAALSEKYGDAEEMTDTGIHGEAFWIPSDRHAVEVFVNASTNGDVFLQLRYTDLPVYGKFYEAIRAQGKNL